MTLRRCQHLNCGTWHDKTDPECPTCGAPRGSYNKHIETSKLNNHLYDGVRSHQQEVHDYHAVRTGAKKPPKWARERAVQVLDTL